MDFALDTFPKRTRTQSKREPFSRRVRVCACARIRVHNGRDPTGNGPVGPQLTWILQGLAFYHVQVFLVEATMIHKTSLFVEVMSWKFLERMQRQTQVNFIKTSKLMKIFFLCPRALWKFTTIILNLIGKINLSQSITMYCWKSNRKYWQIYSVTPKSVF